MRQCRVLGEKWSWSRKAVARINKHQSRRGLAGGVIESSSFETIDTINPSHPTPLTLANSISARPAPLSHTDSSAKKHPSHPRSIHLHSRQHGFGGNYDCVRLACHAPYHFPVLTLPAVSTTARAAETATTSLRDGMPKQTPPTSSSNTRHKPTPNPLSAS
jgi:hypothetical protein